MNNQKTKIINLINGEQWLMARSEIDKILVMPTSDRTYYYFVLKKAEYFIKRNYKKKIKLSDVSNFVGLSQEYLSRIFKDYMPMNYKKYLNFIRIKSAEEMLIYRNASIRKISEEVGFDDEAYFTKVFKKFNGCTPSRFRNIYSFMCKMQDNEGVGDS